MEIAVASMEDLPSERRAHSSIDSGSRSSHRLCRCCRKSLRGSDASSQATVEDQFRSSLGLRSTASSFRRAAGDGGPQAAQDFEVPCLAPEEKFRSSRGLQSSGASFRKSMNKGAPQQTTLPEIPEKAQLQQDPLRASAESVSWMNKAKGKARTTAMAQTSETAFKAEPSNRDMKKYNAIFNRGFVMEQQKETRMQEMRRALSEKEMSECTFQPRFESGTVDRFPMLSGQRWHPKEQRLPASQSEPLIPKMRKTTGPFTIINGVQINGKPRPRAANVELTGPLRRHVINMGAPTQLTSEYMALKDVASQAKDPKWERVKEFEVNNMRKNKYNDALSSICSLVPDPQFVAKDFQEG